MLFRRAAEITTAPSAGYAAAATLIELGAAVALADGRLADAERDRDRAAGHEPPGPGRRRAPPPARALHPGHRRTAVTRVAAQARQPAARALRQEAGDLLLAVALADGSIDRAEVTRVNRYFDALGLDRPELDSRPQAPGAEGLTPCGPPGPPPPVTPYPSRPRRRSRAAAAVTLDPELIRAKLAETEQAASFLAEIFTGENTSSFTALSAPRPRRHAVPAGCKPGSPGTRCRAPLLPGQARRAAKLAAQRSRPHRGRAWPDARRGARDRERSRLRGSPASRRPRAATRLKSTADAA